MTLSDDLISQFVKVTQDEKQTKKESTAYGKIIKQGDVEYVKLDGSDLLTPISSTTVVKDGDRVMVTIKNHEAIVTGDFTNPSANDGDVKELGSKISEFEIIIADKISVQQLEAEVAKIDKIIADNLEATNAKFETIEGKVAEIDTIKADVIEVEKKITAHEGEFTTIRGEIAEFEDVTAEQVEAIEGNFHNLESDYATFKQTTTNKITANEGAIAELDTKKLDAQSATITYANIDFSNIKEAAIEKIFSDSGIIKDLIMKDGNVTGELVGVTIKGDLIEGNTVKADKLVILGEDGIYYKLNVDALGETTASSDEKYQNGLDGSVIIAKSITADRVAVTDLVAFGATIGGYHITDHTLYSGVKSSATNTTRGVFLGDDGQMAVGDANNYLKFFKDANGNYKLEIQASALRFGASSKNVEEVITDTVNNAVDNIQVGGRNMLTNTDFKVKKTITAWDTEKNGDYDAQGWTGYNSGVTNPETCYHAHLTELDGEWVYEFIKDTETWIGTNTMLLSNPKPGEEYTFSCEIRRPVGSKNYIDGGPYYATEVNTTNGFHSNRFSFQNTLDDTWEKFSHVFTMKPDKLTTDVRFYVYGHNGAGTVYMRKPKFELGNKATDWTLAPEDIDTDISNAQIAADAAQTTANEAQTSADNASTAISEAQAAIDVLQNMISTLVTDEDGGSLMTQTANGGWTFSMSNITGNLEAIQAAMETMKSDQGTLSGSLAALEQLINEVANKTAYIVIGEDENGDPCIILGKTDEDFKVRITNEAIDFLEGSTKIAYANNNTFYAEKMIVKNELQIGNGPGFVWRTRENGNMGLVYISG